MQQRWSVCMVASSLLALVVSRPVSCFVNQSCLRSCTRTITTATTTTTTHTSRLFSSSRTSMTETVPTIPLRNGMKHPAIGFGTYKVGYMPASASAAATATNAPSTTDSNERSCVEVVRDALQVGYRCLECAEFYGNQDQVGQAIVESGIDRKDLFLISKVWTTTIEKGPDAIKQQLQTTLQQLQTDYLDLYLIHWPVPGHHVQAYQTLLECRDAGLIRGVGVSNYAWEDYLELKAAIHSVDNLPLVNQIEINPFLYRKNTIQNFLNENVVLQSYRSLRDGKAMTDPTLTNMASRYQKTPAQILGKWCVQKGVCYLPKSTKRHRMVENAQVWDWTLHDDDMQRLDALTTTEHLTAFRQLYAKCVNRDTSKDGTMEGVKLDITVD